LILKLYYLRKLPIPKGIPYIFYKFIPYQAHLSIMPSPTAKAKKKSARLSRLAFQQIRPYRKWVFLILAAMLVEALMGIASPWPLKIVIDNVIGSQPLPSWLLGVDSLIGRSKMALAMATALLLIVITVIGALAGYVNSFYTESVGQYVANDTRLKIYHHLQRLSLGYYDTHQVGKILSTLTTDVSTMQDFVSTSLLTILVDSITIVGILSLMFYINWVFALIAIAVTPFLLVFVFRFKKAVKKSVHEVRKDESSMVAILQQGLESIRVVNAFGTQNEEEDRLKKISLETVHAALRTRKLKALVSPVVSIVVTLCLAVVLWRGSSLVLAGAMTVGALTVILSYLNKFFSPVKDLAKMTNAVAQAIVAMERIQQLLEIDDIIPQKPNAITPDKLKGEIVFEQVSFGYNHETIILKDISMRINCGERIGICGPTGSGKSTVASLIPRFYDPWAGRILIDGADITDYDLNGLRKQVGFVLQDTLLFYGSIAENIAYGKPAATKEEIINAARLANAEEFILKMPRGYDTLVGERGVTLSGGQRQRIGIARAIIRDSPILILDEPTAALDTESERLVMDALEKLMEGRTVITITHRLSTISDYNRIFVINDGVIEEQGTHAELITQGKLYADLYRVQPKTGTPNVNGQVAEGIKTDSKHLN
jgi:ABC-type multidrug transport system fused ATPase/permease subunit